MQCDNISGVQTILSFSTFSLSPIVTLVNAFGSTASRLRTNHYKTLALLTIIEIVGSPFYPIHLR